MLKGLSQAGRLWICCPNPSNKNPHFKSQTRINIVYAVLLPGWQFSDLSPTRKNGSWENSRRSSHNLYRSNRTTTQNKYIGMHPGLCLHLRPQQHCFWRQSETLERITATCRRQSTLGASAHLSTRLSFHHHQRMMVESPNDVIPLPS